MGFALSKACQVFFFISVFIAPPISHVSISQLSRRYVHCPGSEAMKHVYHYSYE
ncbi:hypothetical protein CDL15_Pgr014341 [Punica granatum]|uniref:Uncharacterized protein n=1 Tax=Punica granatum TaxID=22663 RepID=A0A218WDX6_PUNGR|nr:hypothetical protein CDL15_Pgr014341 [Punica granatum]